MKMLISRAAFLPALAAVLLTCTSSQAVTLLDDNFTDGSRLETNLPTESEFFFGTDSALTQLPGIMRYQTPSSSSKAHIYFAEGNQRSRLGNGDTLSVSITLTPRVGMNFDDTSRSFRFGVFRDPTDPKVLEDTNDDGGGNSLGDPWTDAEGYGVQIAMLDDPANTRAPFDLGKRTNLTNTSLLGSSGAYTKNSGGAPVDMNVNTQYTYTMDITRVSDTQTDVTMSISDAGGVLSTHTVTDNGTDLGTTAAYREFDFIHIRWSNEFETATVFDIERILVTGPALIPEPATALLGMLGMVSLTMVRRRK